MENHSDAIKKGWSSHHFEEQAGGFLVKPQGSVQTHTISAAALPLFEHKRNTCLTLKIYLYAINNMPVLRLATRPLPET